MGPGRVIVIAVTGGGVIKNHEISIPINISEDDINEFSKKAEEKLRGIMPVNLNDELKEELENLSSFCPELWGKIYECFCDWFEEDSKKHVYAGGVVNIFNHPEYKDVSKAKEFIGFLDSRDNISRIIDSLEGENDIKIIIGEENSEGALKDCSIIISNYSVGKEARGSIGIIGPTRMDYARIVSSLGVITERLNSIIYKLFF